jgi:hypothetical protein
MGDYLAPLHRASYARDAKCASDAETLERARQLLAHADGKTTERMYRRLPEIIKPLR